MYRTDPSINLADGSNKFSCTIDFLFGGWHHGKLYTNLGTRKKSVLCINNSSNIIPFATPSILLPVQSVNRHLVFFGLKFLFRPKAKTDTCEQISCWQNQLRSQQASVIHVESKFSKSRTKDNLGCIAETNPLTKSMAFSAFIPVLHKLNFVERKARSFLVLRKSARNDQTKQFIGDLKIEKENWVDPKKHKEKGEAGWWGRRGEGSWCWSQPPLFWCQGQCPTVKGVQD